MIDKLFTCSFVYLIQQDLNSVMHSDTSHSEDHTENSGNDSNYHLQNERDAGPAVATETMPAIESRSPSVLPVHIIQI